MADHILLPILAYFIHKNNYSNIFWALSEGPRGSRPTSSNLSPYETHLRFFSPPLYRHLNKRFYSGTPNLQRHTFRNTTFRSPFMRYVHQEFLAPLFLDFNSFYSGTPTSNVTSTPGKSSDFPPRFTYPTIFSRLSTSILTKGLLRHSQPQQPTIRQRESRIPLLAPPPLRFFRLSTSILTLAFTQALPTSNVTSTSTLPSDPLLAVPTLGFFPSLYLHCNKFN